LLTSVVRVHTHHNALVHFRVSWWYSKVSIWDPRQQDGFCARRLLQKDGFYVTFSLMWLFVVFVCFVARPSVLYCVTVVGRTVGVRLAVGGLGRTRRGGFFSTSTHSLRVQVLPLPALHGPAFFAPPPAHTPSRGVRHPSFKVYDRLHHRSPLRFRRWRELCRAPTSPPSFDQRTTRRLPRLWCFLLLVGFPCAHPTPPRPRFFVACRLLRAKKAPAFCAFRVLVPAFFSLCPFPTLKLSNRTASREILPPQHTLLRAPSGTPLRSLSIHTPLRPRASA